MVEDGFLVESLLVKQAIVGSTGHDQVVSNMIASVCLSV